MLSDDNGRTWSTPPQVISATAKYSALPDALVVGDQRFVAWVDQTTEGGQAFALYEAQVAEVGTVAMRSIPSSLPVLGSTRPRLAASEGRLHIVFNAGDDPSRIMYATRALTETAWPTATVIYTATESPGSWFPMLAIDPDEETLHIVWLDLTLDERMIKYMRWDAGQADVYTLSPMDIVENTQWVHPSIAADSFGNLHVVWGEEVGIGSAENLNQYVRYARYDADTSSWSASERIYSELVKVNADDPRDVSPSLALQNKGDEVVVCVAWHGFREGAFVLAEEVLLSCSQDGGQSWSSPQNVSRSLGFDPEYPDVSIIPSITFDALGRLHCVWQERMDMKLAPYYEVYHTRVLSQVFLPLMIRSYE